MLGPFATASRRKPHYHSPGVATVATHAACASMSTTTTTTTRDRVEWAQKATYRPIYSSRECPKCAHSNDDHSQAQCQRIRFTVFTWQDSVCVRVLCACLVVSLSLHQKRDGVHTADT